ncbi:MULTISPECIES: hypothetical protein [unclassified Herbaspirillum]|uniref:hypothetical protein n=1 Tax=unclassified Herbaspirillum TaxID=2624150 RepID=UPI001E3D5BA3|nr:MULTISPECIES: hypothetical protein [unclassified Herbaspirillum]
MAGHYTDADDQNFWPGFVDSMVNMVMYLLLLIAILAMAVIPAHPASRVRRQHQLAAQWHGG